MGCFYDNLNFEQYCSIFENTIFNIINMFRYVRKNVDFFIFKIDEQVMTRVGNPYPNPGSGIRPIFSQFWNPNP